MAGDGWTTLPGGRPSIALQLGGGDQMPLSEDGARLLAQELRKAALVAGEGLISTKLRYGNDEFSLEWKAADVVALADRIDAELAERRRLAGAGPISRYDTVERDAKGELVRFESHFTY